MEISSNDIYINKIPLNLAILVNDTEKALTKVSDDNDSSIIFQLKLENLKQNDVISIVDKNDNTKTYDFHHGEILNDNNKLTKDIDIAIIQLYITPNGFYLEIGEDIKQPTSGMVIAINDKLYPMDYVSYYEGDKMTYIYGWVPLQKNDEVKILNLDVKGETDYLTYNYDNVSEKYSWNVYDYHKGEDNVIVFDNPGYYGFELFGENEKEIYIDKTFAPLDGKEYDIVFKDNTIKPLLSEEIDKTNPEYEGFTWYINHEKVMNGDDKKEYLKNNGLIIYSSTYELNAGDEFMIKNITKNIMINSAHLVALFGDKDSISLNNGYIKVNKKDRYTISYLPLCNSIIISSSEAASGDILMMTGGNSYPLTKDENGNVYYEADMKQFDNVMYVTNEFNTFEITSIDTSLDSSTCYFNSQYSSIMFYKAGHFKLTLNLNTKVLKVEGEVSPSSTSVQYGYLSIIDLSGSGNKTESMTKNNNNVFSITIDLKQNNIISVSTFDSNTNSTTHLNLDSSVSNDIVESYFGIGLMIKSDGNYTVTYNAETDLINIVKNS